MKNRFRSLTFGIVTAGMIAASPLYGQSADEAALTPQPVDEEGIHDALRALKAGAEETFNQLGASGERKHLDSLLGYVHEDIILMPMNGSKVVGKGGIIEYFERTMTGADRTVTSVHHTFDVAALSKLYGDDTAVAYGTSVGTYELAAGLGLTVDTTWTATMVEENGRWLLASFQFAPSIFDNPLVEKAKKASVWIGGGSGLLGLLVGFFVGRRRAAV